MYIDLIFPDFIDNYSGTAPECVERQRNNGKIIIAAEEKQIAEWKEIVESVEE